MSGRTVIFSQASARGDRATHEGHDFTSPYTLNRTARPAHAADGDNAHVRRRRCPAFYEPLERRTAGQKTKPLAAPVSRCLVTTFQVEKRIAALQTSSHDWMRDEVCDWQWTEVCDSRQELIKTCLVASASVSGPVILHSWPWLQCYTGDARPNCMVASDVTLVLASAHSK